MQSDRLASAVARPCGLSRTGPGVIGVTHLDSVSQRPGLAAGVGNREWRFTDADRSGQDRPLRASCLGSGVASVRPDRCWLARVRRAVGPVPGLTPTRPVHFRGPPDVPFRPVGPAASAPVQGFRLTHHLRPSPALVRASATGLRFARCRALSSPVGLRDRTPKPLPPGSYPRGGVPSARPYCGAGT